MTDQEERQRVAKKFALKEGYEWDTLTEQMQKSYLHNADVIIEQAEVRQVEKAIVASGQTVCPICNDGNGWISNKPCLECNPVGLGREERNVSDSGTGQDNQPSGSSDTGQPAKPKKPKAKAKARKKSS